MPLVSAATIGAPAPAIPAPAPAATAPAARLAWVDAAKGMAILLVVFGHAAGGLIDANPPGFAPWLRYGFLAVYTFHMPLFFLLAGLFVQSRLEKGREPFVRGVVRTVVYPYFLWSIVQFTAIYAAGSLVNQPVERYWPTILALPWRTVSQFWFLHALFLIHLLALIAWRLGGARAVLATAVLLKVLAYLMPTVPALNLAAANAPYYALGMLIGPTRLTEAVSAASPRVRASLAGGALVSVAVLLTQANALQSFATVEHAISPAIARIAWLPAMLPAAILCSAALLVASHRVAGGTGAIAGAVRYLGTMTMPIFLLHILFIAGTRIVLDKLLGVSGTMVLPMLIAAGIAGPLLVRIATDRARLTRLLALG